jgi:hypothetical protein
MRKLLTLLIALVSIIFAVCSLPASAQIGGLMFPGPGRPAASGGGGYTGPGDVKTSWTAWWGTRAFSAATAGNRLINICNSTGGTDVTCADAFSNASTGVLVIPGSLTSFCPGANCTIKTYYDQSGASACSGPCDETQATVASRATLTASALGTGTCGVATGTQIYTVSGFASLAQPFTVSAVVQYAALSAGSNFIGTNNTGWGTLSSTVFGFYASSNVSNGTTVGTSPHAFQGVAGGSGATASFLVIDTSVGSGSNSGNLSTGNTIWFYTDSFGTNMKGAICEVGFYPAAFNTTDASNMYGNQHTFWGF